MLRDSLSPATRVLGVTWVHSSSGLKMPLRGLAAALREVNATRAPAQRVILVVDGAHGLGADDPRVAETGIDVLAAALHKWILAPRGTGIVWARRELWDHMRPVVPSFQSEELFNAWIQQRAPRRPFPAAYFGLGGFQAYEHVWAIPAAEARIQMLNGRLREELAAMPRVRLHTPRDPALSAGITAFEVEGLSPEAVVGKLRERRILASTSPYHPTYPRVSFGIANSEADVDRTVAAIRALG
ncbi:MAG: hypothetical protein DMF82_24350 [Acidobacteria bacterium]|nr:MAG: hypothetical protein DMF82_24350 [Acidobacteriota bacterium]